MEKTKQYYLEMYDGSTHIIEAVSYRFDTRAHAYVFKINDKETFSINKEYVAYMSIYKV